MCSLIIELQPSSFLSDRSKIVYLITLMSGRDLAWATAVSEQQLSVRFSLGEFVAEKDKTLRPCIDYQILNDITVKIRYPLPLISSAFEPLQGATVFSKLDLQNAYHLVRIQDGDEWKTAFYMASSHHKYLVMPFGFTNIPAVFQALVNDVLRFMLNRFIFVYLDDILVFSHSAQEHVLHVPFTWSKAADGVFRDLKHRFTTPPILVHPDLS
eukprot:XP_014001813.1 PREDICTED: RNA-directed DNA polymerase homolog [Salmo salar]